MFRKKNRFRNNVYIFNLSTDRSNPILAFTIDWIKAFYNLNNSTTVISTHVGVHDLPNNIKIVEIGGGNFWRRLRGLIRLFNVGIQVILARKEVYVFHHMSIRSAALLGAFFKLARVPQGLWYSHSVASLELKIGSFFVDRIFSSTEEAFPIKNRKAIYIGHGIKIENFSSFSKTQRESAILSLGRVARIKNNEKLIKAVHDSDRSKKEIHLVGPLQESKEYLEELINLGKELQVEVKYLGQVNHDQIPKLLNTYSICYTGNPNTIDKSVIEGAMSGCFPLSDQEFVLRTTGMQEIFNNENLKMELELSLQLNILASLEDRLDLRLKLRELAFKQNSVDKLATKIVDELKMI